MSVVRIIYTYIRILLAYIIKIILTTDIYNELNN